MRLPVRRISTEVGGTTLSMNGSGRVLWLGNGLELGQRHGQQRRCKFLLPNSELAVGHRRDRQQGFHLSAQHSLTWR